VKDNQTAIVTVKDLFVAALDIENAAGSNGESFTCYPSHPCFCGFSTNYFENKRFMPEGEV
jgi:hypothetical protein